MAVAFMENQRGEFRTSEQTDALTRGGGKPGQGYAAAAVGMSVRRLTPRECERLQGFPEIENEVTIFVWSTERQKIGVHAAISNLKSQKSALDAGAEKYLPYVKTAGQNSSISLAGNDLPVAVNVQIDLERGQVLLHNPKKSAWLALTADKQNLYLRLAQGQDFALLLALMPKIAEKITLNGRAELQQSIRHFSQGLNGKIYAAASGREIAELAFDAQHVTDVAKNCTKFITSEAGQSTQNLEQIWQTSLCCVSAVINSFIQNEIQPQSLYALNLKIKSPYTLVPDGKKMTADGPRYKMLGNSMAVPVMAWIGQRIQMVEDMT
jgi:hypothetical protein